MTQMKDTFGQYLPRYTSQDMVFYDDVRKLPFIAEELVLDTCLIVVCMEGMFQIEIKGKRHQVSRNSLLVCLPNDKLSHCMLSPNCQCQIVALSPSLIRESVTESHLWEKIFSLTENPVVSCCEEDIPKLNLYRDLLFLKIKEEENNMNREIINSFIRAIFYEILQQVEDKHPSYGEKLVTRREVLFKNFIELISNMSVKPRRVDWYADKLCVTPKYLSQMCKDVSGKTATAWIQEYVQKDINYLLKNSNKSIKEIADELMFPNLSFFGKYIRGYCGMSPTEYRKHLRT